MTAALDLMSYMTRLGWEPVNEGPAGTMWALPTTAFRIGVPSGVQPGTIEWRAVVERLATAADAEPADVDYRVTHEHLDEALLRAANDELIVESIPLSAGQAMVGSASKMLRAAATTARGPKANIGTHLADGDRIFELARMGHTRRGSYLIPVLMPVPPPELRSTASSPPLPGLELAEEPIQRRTMRTFAEALTAISRLVVEPAVMPRPSVVASLVTAGVSRQFLDAVRTILDQPSVHSFGAQFAWAGAVPAPRRTVADLQIPQAAAPLIATAAVHMAQRDGEQAQTMTGPIVDWHRDRDADHGWIGIQTVRNGHEVVVRVELDGRAMSRAWEYVHESQTVVVRGVPAGGRGRAVRINEPESFTSLHELMLHS